MTNETKTLRLIKLMKRRWVSLSVSVSQLNLYSLSQRAGEIEREHGYKVDRKWVKSKDGRNACMAYRITGKGC